MERRSSNRDFSEKNGQYLRVICYALQEREGQH